jgi:endonuclease YncB( thermonuclease family)
MWDRRARIPENHDGDTVTVVLDQGFGDTKTIKVRLAKVYAPELAQPGGPETTAFVHDWLAQRSSGSWPFVCTTVRTRTDVETTTLGRYVAYITCGAESLNDAITDFIAANGYGGGIGAKP